MPASTSITEQGSYRASILALAREGLAAHEIHEALVVEDIRQAADALAGVFVRTGGRDGYVSLEISPHLATDTEGTYWEAIAALDPGQSTEPHDHRPRP